MNDDLILLFEQQTEINRNLTEAIRQQQKYIDALSIATKAQDANLRILGLRVGALEDGGYNP